MNGFVDLSRKRGLDNEPRRVFLDGINRQHQQTAGLKGLATCDPQFSWQISWAIRDDWLRFLFIA
jgi:hypothetical protein